jgi:3-oxoadipate enol-lactonase
VLARVDRLEREGLRGAVEDSMANGYAPELRNDPASFAAFRARWLGNDPASYAAIYRMLAGMDLQSELASIRCPVLVLGGALDRVRPPALVEPVARAIPGARYLVLQTGHYMSVATPGLVADAIGGFLDEVGA